MLRIGRSSLVRRFTVGMTMIALAYVGNVVLDTGRAEAAPRSDYDLDDNGLIEINDIQDLDQIRIDPFGTHLYASDAGCPMPQGCRGFELTADLDFDTNGDGVVNDSDSFFAPGTGWVPIGTLAAPFQGHGHTIRNLTILQPTSTPGGPAPTGLFSTMVGALVNELRLENVYIVGTDVNTGALVGNMFLSSAVRKVSVVGGIIDTANQTAFGGVAGRCEFSSVEESYTSLEVVASESVGGLIGHSEQCDISRSFVLGRTVNGRYHRAIGGLVGTMVGGSIEDSFVTGTTGLGINFGGLIGEFSTFAPTVMNSFVSGAVVGTGSKGGALLGFGDATFVSTFYATDTTGFNKTKTGGDPAAVGVTLADLKCPEFAGDPECFPGLYVGWGATFNSDGQPAWDFGSEEQVPALRIAGVVYRDSDGDGVLDADDKFPFNWEASLDSDDDGSIDFWREGCDEQCRAGSSLVLDQFPENAAATVDLDLDGMPDTWNPGCDANCQNTSGLTLDPSPDDMDNDGLADLDDSDDGNDGNPDVDLDSNNLIDIRTIKQLALVTNDPTGASRRYEGQIGYAGDIDDNSGCRPRVVRGTLRRECDGYELLNDLDFDLDGNGVIDQNDTIDFEFDYNGDGQDENSWSYGAGWLPLGRLGDVPFQAFQTNFEGHGHTISNLYVNGRQDAGLFGGVRGANIRNVGLVGNATVVVGESRVGPLVAHLITSTISNCYSTVRATSTTSASGVGGLIGTSEGSVIAGCFATGDVETNEGFGCGTGGLVGHMDFDASLSASFATGSVFADCAIRPNTELGTAGGLVGTANAGVSIANSYSTGPVAVDADAQAGGLVGRAAEGVLASYWATNSSGQVSSSGAPQPALLDQLQCPVDADNADDCLPGGTLYDGWGDLRTAGYSYWDFGSASDLPGLCLEGSLYRANEVGVLQAPVDCTCSLQDDELVSNQSFESSAAGWAGLGATVSTSTSQAHSGSSSLRVSNRTAGWNGGQYNLLNIAAPGDTLGVGLWARIENDSSEPVFFTLRSTCQGANTSYSRIAEATVTNSGWTQLVGTANIPDCNLTELVAYAEGPRASVNFYIDDVSITSTSSDCGGGDLTGVLSVSNNWGNGFCAEVVVTNHGVSATSDWSAEFDLNGAVIYDSWNIDTMVSGGTVTVTPTHSWGQVIQPAGSTYSLGFCVMQPGGGTAIPAVDMEVTGQF